MCNVLLRLRDRHDDVKLSNSKRNRRKSSFSHSVHFVIAHIPHNPIILTATAKRSQF